MKSSVLLILALILISMQTDDSNKILLCHKWMQFAFKSHSAASANAVSKSMAKECVFNEDGSYQETVYNNALNNTLKISGKWYLNSDQTKLGYKFEEINGYKLPVSSDTARHFNTIILKLTTDTLIYGNEAYYGNNKVYGHDDWYFVREK